MKYVSRDEVRSLDRRAIEEFGIPGVVLMENAGRGAAEIPALRALAQRWEAASALSFAGPSRVMSRRRPIMAM